MLTSLSRPSARRVVIPAVGAVRYLNVHEHIGMDILKKHGIPVPEGYVASTAEEAESIFKLQLRIDAQSRKDAVVKAQVLSGGRGRGHFKNGFQGGVHVATSPEEVRHFARQMLGQELVTKQAPNGIPCYKVYLMERVYMRKEMYLSILMDRASQGPLMVASPVGGTTIEDVAASNSEVILSQSIDLVKGLTDDQCKNVTRHLGMEEGTPTFEKTVTLMTNLYAMFLSCDCTQVEVNPLAETPTGDIVVCDAKVNFDDNAEYRQPTIFACRDYTQEDPREVEASTYNLNYIGLDGSIGCMVNGAGLAMSTMDIIQLKGGAPANFLDVGGGATEQQVQKGFEILNNDLHVQAILVNIFGGIMHCDVIAKGIINTVKEIGIRKPVVIRLQGTNAAKAKALIEDSGINMILANDLEDAATKAVGVVDITTKAKEIGVKVTFNGLSVCDPSPCGGFDEYRHAA